MTEQAKIIAGEYTLAYVEKPDDDVWSVVGGGISDYNARQFASDQGKRLCFVVYGPDQEVVGGVIGETFWDWLYISLMFVKDELRGRGFGGQLLALAEDEARRRGVKNAYLDTFSFQAPDFYKKCGYRVFGELPDFPAGHTRYFMTKAL